MVLEWLRRHDPALDNQLRRYLFTQGPIADTEADDDGTAADAGARSLEIGSLQDEEGL